MLYDIAMKLQQSQRCVMLKIILKIMTTQIDMIVL